MVRQKRVSFWFWVALVALLTNPMVWRLLLNVLTFVLQFVAAHVAVLH